MALSGSFPNEDARRTVDLASLSPDRLLVLFGGISAIGFGLLALVLHLAGQGPLGPFGGFTALGGVVFSFAVAVVFGLGLLLAYATMAARTAEGSILALTFSIVLFVAGGLPGLVAGIVGLVGALVGVVRNLKFVA